jgi:hypothetical protein
MRDDGDFQLIATLNNNDGFLGNFREAALASELLQQLQSHFDEKLELLKRQDAPDYITIEGE